MSQPSCDRPVTTRSHRGMKLSPQPLHDRLDTALVIIALAGLASGLALMLAGQAQLAALTCSAGAIPILSTLPAEIVRSLAKGEVGLDTVAALSMSFALLFG